MKRNVLYLFLTLLLATALAALAQSPTSSNPGGSETKDPYGATLDHPNPSSANPSAAPVATGQPDNANNVNQGQTPATGMSTATAPSPASPDPSGSSTATTDNNANQSLPRTASELPLLAIIGLLAVGGALTVRSLARRGA
jgi:hypothetical protein